MTQGVFQEESLRLQYVLRVIDRELEAIWSDLSRHNAELREVRKEEFLEGLRGLSFEDRVDITQGIARIAAAETRQRSALKRALRLERMKSSPYFARIDFLREGTKTPLKVYIGIASLIDPETKEHLVFDWRAPISSMYYDFGLGPAAYKAVKDEIRGEITLKRQYKIEDGVLIRVFDTDLAITDELLQEVLGSAPGDKMRTIVNTIQQEQNRVIRDDSHKVLVVQGAAGSGKTSVALHRAAYLLYKYREMLTADDIVIFSPNRVFSDYISQVLPELGENQVAMKTFKELVSDITKVEHIQTYASQVESLLSGQGAKAESRVAGAKFKSTREYLQMIYDEVDRYENLCPFDRDIVHLDEVIITKEELRDMYHGFYSYLPPFARARKILSRVEWVLSPLERQRAKQIEQELNENPDNAMTLPVDIRDMAAMSARQEFNEIKEGLAAQAPQSVMEAYKSMLRRLAEGEHSATALDTLEALELGFIPYEDAAPYAFMHCLLEGAPSRENVKHVIIDEAQDYSLVQYEILRLIYPAARFTIVGDLHQTVNPSVNLGNYDVLSEVFGRDETFLVTLKKSYRSTVQILSFAGAVLGVSPAEPAVQRRGPLPVVCVRDDFHLLMDDMTSHLSKTGGSSGVILRTARQAVAVSEALRQRGLNPRLVTTEDEHFSRGLVVLPIYLAKGLEFESAVVPLLDGAQYQTPEERRLIYTACTRALHRLDLYVLGRTPSVIESIDPSLYRLIK